MSTRFSHVVAALTGIAALAIWFPVATFAEAQAQGGAQAEARSNARALLEHSEVELGRAFQLRLEVRHSSTRVVQWPRVFNLGDAIEERARETQRQEQDGQALSEAVLTLMAFDTAIQVLPALAITLVDASGEHETIHSPEIALRITGIVDPELLNLRPMAAPVPVEVRDTRYVAMAGGIPILILFFLLWRSRQHSAVRPGKPVPARESTLAPHTEALARLDALEESGALDAAVLKPAYLEMSEIFREYLGRRFGFSCLDLTTSEIRSRLFSIEGSYDWRRAVVRWLSDCDLIKYAKSPADPDEARQALYAARVLIEKIKPISQARPKVVARA